jgi:trk system potassium uptake protein TrkH
MNFRGISFYLSLSCYPITFLSFFSIIYSSYFNHYLNLDSYVYTLIISFVLGVSFYFLSKNSKKDIKFHEQLILIFLVYLIASSLISIPYYFSYYKLSFIDSFFEAMSGLTTTGFTVFDNIKFLDPTLLIWRSFSHWIGGLFFLIFLILIFSNFKSEYKLTNLVFNPDKATSIFNDTQKIIIKVFFLYLLLTGLIFILFAFSGIRLFNSFNLAMSISSTGAFLPTNELSEIIRNSAQKIILIISMTFTTLNIYFFYSLLNQKNIFKKHQEDFLILIAIAFFSLILFFSIKEIPFLNILLNVVSSLSNSGLTFDDPPKNFYLLFIFLTILGGSVISNSSGIKFIRLYILFKHSVMEIFKLVSPNIIIDQTILRTEHKTNNENLNSSFFIFICFFISIFILSSILTTNGLNFETSFKISILTVTNTVNSSLFGIEEFFFSNLSLVSKISIIFFMVVGKIELISVFLILFKINNFKN